jgi:hypothetical protein
VSDRRSELSASAFLSALAGAACVGAYRLGLGDVHTPGPGFMPFATAALLGLMALGYLVQVVIANDSDGDKTPAFASSRWAVVVIVLGALAGFGAAIDAMGFSISAFLMLLVLFGVVARRRWWIALLSALLIVCVARVVFRALGMQFPDGPLGL